jgi:hypothetical protein
MKLIASNDSLWVWINAFYFIEFQISRRVNMIESKLNGETKNILEDNISREVDKTPNFKIKTIRKCFDFQNKNIFS